MKHIYLSLLVFLLMLPFASRADGLDDAANLIKQANTKELSKVFAASIDIVIMDNDGTYSKTQAVTVLDKFFAERKIQGVKLLHKVNSSANYHLGVYLLTTDKGVYRIAITLKDAANNMNIIELRIEDEKVK